jgi:tripartite-type tricarboxylate transporter receptor subunit TctC
MARLCGLAVAFAAAGLGAPAAAQDYPSKPIRVIASSAAGGISDIFMRTVGEELNRRWGQPLVIEAAPAPRRPPTDTRSASCRTRS